VQAAQARAEVPCPTGQARMTINPVPPSTIPCVYIIHAVGPICGSQGLQASTSQLLKDAYSNSLKTAAAFNKNPNDSSKHFEFQFIKKHIKITSIAFPPISTGIFGCEPDKAALLAIEAVIDFFNHDTTSGITDIEFVFFDPKNSAKTDADFKYYTEAIKNYA
jgi:O-acetyl-ADP-ribose deacetylase (regulator of RNase III)